MCVGDVRCALSIVKKSWWCALIISVSSKCATRRKRLKIACSGQIWCKGKSGHIKSHSFSELLGLFLKTQFCIFNRFWDPIVVASECPHSDHSPEYLAGVRLPHLTIFRLSCAAAWLCGGSVPEIGERHQGQLRGRIATQASLPTTSPQCQAWKGFSCGSGASVGPGRCCFWMFPVLGFS